MPHRWPCESPLGSIIRPLRSSPLPIIAYWWPQNSILDTVLTFYQGHPFICMVCYSHLSAAPRLVLSSALIFPTACWVYEYMLGCNGYFKFNKYSLKMVFISHHLPPPSALSSIHSDRLVVVPPVCHPLPQFPYICSLVN